MASSALSVTGAGLRHREPTLVVKELRTRLPGAQVVGDAQGELGRLAQLLDDVVVVGNVPPAARVADAGDADALHRAPVVAGRVGLLRQRQLRPHRRRRVEDRRRGLGDRHARGVAVGAAFDDATRRVQPVPAEADRAQGRPAQERPAVEMEDADPRVRGGPVDLLQRRHAARAELKLGPAGRDADPCRGGGPPRPPRMWWVRLSPSARATHRPPPRPRPGAGSPALARSPGSRPAAAGVPLRRARALRSS